MEIHLENRLKFAEENRWEFISSSLWRQVSLKVFGGGGENRVQAFCFRSETKHSSSKVENKIDRNSHSRGKVENESMEILAFLAGFSEGVRRGGGEPRAGFPRGPPARARDALPLHRRS